MLKGKKWTRASSPALSHLSKNSVTFEAVPETWYPIKDCFCWVLLQNWVILAPRSDMWYASVSCCCFDSSSLFWRSRRRQWLCKQRRRLGYWRKGGRIVSRFGFGQLFLWWRIVYFFNTSLPATLPAKYKLLYFIH